MPSGKIHDRVTLWSLPWIVAVSLLVTRNGSLTLIIAGGFLFSGLMFGPDLDIHSIQFKRWGILSWLWLPYQKILHHRSLFSHGPVIGTTLRLIYLSSFFLLLAIFGVALGQLFWGFHWNWQEFAVMVVRGIAGKYRGEAIALFLGLESGAMSHSLSDTIGSAWKRYQKRKAARPQQEKKRKTRPRSKGNNRRSR